MHSKISYIVAEAQMCPAYRFSH